MVAGTTMKFFLMECVEVLQYTCFDWLLDFKGSDGHMAQLCAAQKSYSKSDCPNPSHHPFFSKGTVEVSVYSWDLAVPEESTDK